MNAQPGGMLRDHRGMDVERRAKAIFWWCYEHSPSPLPPAEVLRVMPTDRSIAAIYRRLGERQRLEGTIPRWGGRHRLVGAAPLGAVANGLGLVGHTFCPITLNNG